MNRGQVNMQDPVRRKEGVQRIQIGLSGLAGVVLLIGLANIVVDNVRKGDASQDITADAGNAAAPAPVGVPEDKPTEPLAELGVAPASDSGAQQPVVADLQPDPNLKEPMDRPPPVAPTLPPDRRKPATQP